MEYVLRTSGLSKEYGGKLAVNNVSLNVRKGDIYGFIGKNGAGKTTLMRMVTGLANPDKGEMELFGGKDFVQGRWRIGSMLEAPSFYPYLTAQQNLEVQRKLLGNPDKTSIDRVLQIVGLTDTGKKTARNFSMGMRQRLGIALCLLGDPDFLILDEPINGLDPTGIKEVRDLIMRLNAEHGITVLLSSHILGELAKIATCYGIINNGVLVDEFSAQELEVRCKRCLKIVVSDAKKAAHVLETVVKTTNYDVLDDHSLRLFDYIDDASMVNMQLVKNDIVVESIAPAGQDLEGYFMQLMGGAQYA